MGKGGKDSDSRVCCQCGTKRMQLQPLDTELALVRRTICTFSWIYVIVAVNLNIHGDYNRVPHIMV